MRLGKVDGAAAAFLEISAPFCQIIRQEGNPRLRGDKL